MILRACTVCGALSDQGRCEEHRPVDDRPSAAKRGYGAAWAKIRSRYLATHPTCVLCGAPATVPDHYPVTRRQLVAQGVTDPDADRHLRPLCKRDHDRSTASRDGGFGRRSRAG